MENEQTAAPKPLPGKKEMKQQLADKIETALPDLKAILGDKKFANRIKKAAKLLMEGLHKEDLANNKKPQAKQATEKKAANKKAAAEKKATAKKATTKNTKAAPAKKAKAAKKSGAGK